MLMRVLPRHDSRQTGTTQTGSNIASLKCQACVGELIDVGSPDMRMPHKSVVRPSVIIGNDHDDIRRFCGRSAGRECPRSYELGKNNEARP